MENNNSSISLKEVQCISHGMSVLFAGYKKIYDREMTEDEFFVIGEEIDNLLFTALDAGKSVSDAFACAFKGHKVSDMFSDDLNIIDDAIQYCTIEYRYFADIRSPLDVDINGKLVELVSMLCNVM